MRTVSLTVIALAFAPLAGVGNPKPKQEAKAEAVAKELRRLAGTWECVYTLTPGGGRIEREGRTTRIVFLADGSFELLHQGGEPITGKITLNPTARPKRVDFTYTDTELERTQYGLYEWEGESFVTVTGAVNSPRPADFTVTKGSGRVYHIYRRIMDKK
jgi:uncharacterized protein (TIGR03067 family)